MRAIHFFGDNDRAKAETEALKNNRFEDFLTLVNESGDSSMNYLQNLYSCRKPTEQGIPLAIMAGKRILKGKGAVRVHGGGFAGLFRHLYQMILSMHIDRKWTEYLDKIRATL